ncbi:MAG: hypothetical protein ACLUKN_08995 [Bacilli bacterium]
MQAYLRDAMIAVESGYKDFGGKRLSSEQMMRMLDVCGAEKGLKWIVGKGKL